MRLLVVFLLAALGCSLAEGLNMTKCGLKDKLTVAIGDLPVRAKQRGLTVENLVAKLVCHVDYASGFNTGAVNQLTTGTNHNRGKRSITGGMFGPAPFEFPAVTFAPRTTRRRQARHAHTDEEQVYTLYGLFQLSTHLVCSDGVTESPNMCNMDCKNLLDDNIHDDISCVLKLFTALVESGFAAPHMEELKKMILLIYQPECRYIDASEYFAECS